jgi:hypothetical protein
MEDTGVPVFIALIISAVIVGALVFVAVIIHAVLQSAL